MSRFLLLVKYPECSKPRLFGTLEEAQKVMQRTFRIEKENYVYDEHNEGEMEMIDATSYIGETKAVLGEITWEIKEIGDSLLK